MQILLRRLYNGGFNHLKSASFLVQRAPRTVIPASSRFCTTDAQESNVRAPSMRALVLLRPRPRYFARLIPGTWE
ncbi:hypothetical protein DAEQUDRAFT_366531 [Daedalea quercina L-15889]|uniref:Uncharacterized protein n=1 Tax=Daedalea quercina L-15889 TaxID=1314783 RepID=A0A165P9T4_9APHY|nr:hypothetical protein DAEQUDRAFT_366531 [Daedalea quercina L-15889]